MQNGTHPDRPAGAAADEFGQWMRTRRKALDLTQAGLAAQTGCSESTIRKIEAGVLRPSRQVADLLAARLGVPAAERAGVVQWARRRAGTSGPPAVPLALRAAAPLPIPPTALVDREEDLDRLHGLLTGGAARIITLTGPPGVGKTRLALQIAGLAGGDFADGVRLVELAPVSDPHLVLPTIAAALGVRDSSGQALTAGLAHHLHTRHLLLILDNFEQVIAAAAPVAGLLSAAPRLRILVTSREELRVRGEQVYPVPPLAVPGPVLPPLAELAQVPAVSLFLQRARDTLPDFALDARNAPAIAAICRRVEGLPLALELAAGRLALLPPAALLARLDRCLPLLVGGPRDLPATQQTMRAALAWSYALLDADEQRLFAQLAVFRGGASLDAIGQVVDCPGPGGLLEMLAALRRKSLVQQEPAGEEPQFAMLELIREYAQERLDALEGGGAATRDRHSAYYLALAEAAGQALDGPQQQRWGDRLEREHGNFRSALHWSLEAGRLERASRLAVALSRFWLRRGHWTEGRHWLERILAHAPAEPETLQAALLHSAGLLAYRQGDYGPARQRLESAGALWEALDDRAGRAAALQDLGMLALLEGETARAGVLLDAGLALARAGGDQQGMGQALAGLGLQALRAGDPVRAQAVLTTALTCFAASGDHLGLVRARQHLGQVARELGDYAAARGWFLANREASRALGSASGEAAALGELGLVALAEGDTATATALTREALTGFQTLGSKQDSATAWAVLGLGAWRAGDLAATSACCREALADCPPVLLAFLLTLLAGVALTTDRSRLATLLAGAAAIHAMPLGVPLDPIFQQEYAQMVAAARAALGEATFAVTWAEGQILDRAAARALAATL